jgi:hypothetical protein
MEKGESLMTLLSTFDGAGGADVASPPLSPKTMDRIQKGLEKFGRQPLVVLCYRYGNGGMKIGLFHTQAQAEMQAVWWVQEDYPKHEVNTMADIRRLEASNNEVLEEDDGYFAIQRRKSDEPQPL